MQENASPQQYQTPIHFGELFDSYLKRHRTHKSVLARMLGKSFNMVTRYRKAASAQSSMIETLSRILQHNFFLDMAAQLPAHYTTSLPPDTSIEMEIAALKQEILILKAEKELLLQVANRG